MVFSSYVFLFLFFPIVFLLYFLIPKLIVRNVILIIASLLFYAYGEPIAVLLMIISIVFNYFCGRMMTNEKCKKFFLFTAVVFNIGMLFVFKYLTYTLSEIKNFCGLSINVPDIALPIGISFFTFQALSYVIDAYRDKSLVRKNILDIFLYISFFPQLIAGPIIKFSDIVKQINSRKIDVDLIVEGIRRFVCGLSKKLIIADCMSEIADFTFSTPTSELNVLTTWIGAICYVFQIYFDFSGYSDMAIGLGKMFGFSFKENFNYPFAANGMTDFWRKWNISVSSWFKDYVYIPLGGNRKGKNRTVINKIIVFLLTGIWHGANLTFLLWGALHGFFLMLEGYNIVPRKIFSKKIFSPIAHLYSIVVIVLTFVVFRADNISYAFSYIAQMFTGGFEIDFCTKQTLAFISPYTIIIALLGVIVSVPVIPKIKNFCIKKGFLKIYDITASVSSIMLFAFLTVLLSSTNYTPFIYFRF